jgi:hypothetical protein
VEVTIESLDVSWLSFNTESLEGLPDIELPGAGGDYTLNPLVAYQELSAEWDLRFFITALIIFGLGMGTLYRLVTMFS